MTRTAPAAVVAPILVLAAVAMLACALFFACAYQRSVSSNVIPNFPRVLPVSAGLVWAAAGASVLKNRAGASALPVCGVAASAMLTAVLLRLLKLGWMTSPGGVPSAGLLAFFALVTFLGALGAFLSRAGGSSRGWAGFAFGSGLLAAVFFLAVSAG